MKNKFLFSLSFLALVVFISAFTYQTNQLPQLPEYDIKMFKPSVSCSSQAWFNSCSANCNENQNCSCDGGVFFCSCSCTTPANGGGGKNPKQITHNLPSVDEHQYKNWVKFSNFLLKELGTDNAKAVHVALVNMANSLIESNEEDYNKNALLVNNLFHKMSKFEKDKLNTFFAQQQANIKI